MQHDAETRQLRASAQSQLETVSEELKDAHALVTQLSALHDQLAHIIDTIDNGVGATGRRKSRMSSGVTVENIVSVYRELRPKHPTSSTEQLEQLVRDTLKSRGVRLQGFSNRWRVALTKVKPASNGAFGTTGTPPELDPDRGEQG